ncbi:MAG: hypothetical protein M5R37_14785 [Melioribacteraceae bacterium]|nr:hypothetical protein [Melioribacteraceae bacterium]
MDQLANQPNSVSVWQQLKEAIRGSEADYTKIPIGKAIFLLAIPMILELIGSVKSFV